MVRGSAGEEVADKMAGGLGFSYATQPKKDSREGSAVLNQLG